MDKETVDRLYKASLAADKKERAAHDEATQARQQYREALAAWLADEYGLREGDLVLTTEAFYDYSVANAGATRAAVTRRFPPGKPLKILEVSEEGAYLEYDFMTTGLVSIPVVQGMRQAYLDSIKQGTE